MCIMMCNMSQNVVKGSSVSVKSETIVRVYMLILYISNTPFQKMLPFYAFLA